MSLVIKPKSKSKEKPATGMVAAAAADCIDLGLQRDKFGEREMVSILFELEQKNSDGEHYVLSRKFTKSLHPKSALRQSLESWRSKPFSEEELESGFDLTKVIGQPCMLYLEEKEDGYISIEGIYPPDQERIHRPSGQYTPSRSREDSNAQEV